MAKDIVTPAEMVSSPLRLQISLALEIVSISSILQFGPSAPIDSYSGPPYLGSISILPSAFTVFLQRTEQAQQASSLCLMVSLICSALTFSAPSITDSRKLLVGSMPMELRGLTALAVPSSLKPLMPSYSLEWVLNQRASSLILSGSDNLTFSLPRTAIARRSLLPITAPIPQRPLKCLRSLTILAKRTSFSPAGPHCSTRTLLSSSSWRISSSTSPVSLPQSLSAERSSALPSLIEI